MGFARIIYSVAKRFFKNRWILVGAILIIGGTVYGLAFGFMVPRFVNNATLLISGAFRETISSAPQKLAAEIPLGGGATPQSKSTNVSQHGASASSNAEEASRVPATPTSVVHNSENAVNVTQSTNPKGSAKICSYHTAGVDTHKIVLSEIAWMGTSDSANNEWIELHNRSGQSVFLAGWHLLSRSGHINISFAEADSIAAGGFYLLERTDDNTLPTIRAQKIYSGVLENAGDGLALLDDSCDVVDDADDGGGWTDGDAVAKKTMERNVDNFGWHTSALSGGTPMAGNSNPQPQQTARENSSVSTPPSSTPQSTADDGAGTAPVVVPAPEQIPAPAPTYEKLIITEVRTAGTDNVHDEFMEIYNPSGASVDLSGWYIQKKTKSAAQFSTFAPKSLFEGKSIPARGYFVIAYPSSTEVYDVATDYGISDDNTLALKNPDGIVTDKVGWGSANDCEGTCASNPTAGQSIARNFAGIDFVDTDNNQTDLVLACSSPHASSASCPVVEAPASTASAENPTSSPVVPVVAVSHPLILEVQISGGAGKTDEDFIKLYNPGTSSFDVGGWKLRKRTQSGLESSVKVFDGGSTILAVGYFIWANSKNDFAAVISAQTSSTQTLAANNSIALLDSNGNVIDALAWGSDLVGPFGEGSSPYPINPVDSQHLVRKWVGDSPEDTDNNQSDFEIQ